MIRVAGVDGCRRGWVVVEATVENERIAAYGCRIAEDMHQIFTTDLDCVAIDIPIGLLEERMPGGRECDRLTRKRLGRRASSVFSPPVRPILGATTYDEVRSRGLSIQAFHIMPKIAAVDRWITPERQQRLIEGHPELAFATLAGRAMEHNKKRRKGAAERIGVLADHLPDIEDWAGQRHFLRKDVALDDLIDAAVLTLVARDYLLGRAVSLPDPPPRDERGLQMTIWTVSDPPA